MLYKLNENNNEIVNVVHENCSSNKFTFLVQLSFVSSYMDLHMIYGISNGTAAFLRTFKNGMLNSTYRHGQHWLPDSDAVTDDCFSVTNPPICYKAGKNILL